MSGRTYENGTSVAARPPRPRHAMNMLPRVMSAAAIAVAVAPRAALPQNNAFASITLS